MEGGLQLKKQWFIFSKQGKISDYYDYDPKKIIGSGTYGNVIKAVSKGGSIPRAIKIIPKNKVKNKQRFKNEIDIMIKLDHPNVIKLFESFEDARNIYLVMEYCEGGELFDRIIDKGQFTESQARIIFRQLMSALNYCHHNKICHRDLKPENFLLLNKSEDSPIKVIDFGLSCMFDDFTVQQKVEKGLKANMSTRAGTPYYISPEVLRGDYDQSCDIWSAGVILYILLSGVPPFYGNTDQEILLSVKKGQFSFDGQINNHFNIFGVVPEFKAVGEQARDLIRKMITKPENRLTAQQVLEHPWMKLEEQEKSKLKLNFNHLKNFQNIHKLKKATLTYIASQLNETEITELGKLFRNLDKNFDGVLSIDEILEGLQGVVKKAEVEQLLKSIDTDGSGQIDYTEFLAATMEKNVYMKEEKLYMAFKMFDLDGSGKISANELKQVLGSNLIIVLLFGFKEDDNFQNIDQNFWENIIKESDKNGDGEIDYSEFIEMMDKLDLAKK